MHASDGREAGEQGQAASDEAQQPEDQERDESGEGPALEDFQQLLRTGSSLTQDFLELLAIEGRLAGRSLALMVNLAVAMGLLLAGTWLLLGVAVALWLSAQGVAELPAALLMIALGNAVVVLVLWWAIHRVSGNLAFPAFVTELRALLARSEGGPST
jgi:hypothetical protein